MRSECYFCHNKTIQTLLEKFKPEPKVAEDFIFSIHELIAENRNMINPKLATLIHRMAKNKLNVADLYSEEKQRANQLLLDQYKYWRGFIDLNDNPYHTAIKLAVIGNIIDYGAHSLNGDLSKQIDSLLAKPLSINQSDELIREIEKADAILYLGDNAGEIVFDRLFIETMQHPNITYATRAYPVINDVTLDDAKQVGIDKLCKVINNGYDAPSTLLESCSEEFIEAYHHADLIISKGQGNFEGLMNEKHKNTFFLLIAKCVPMAEMLGSKKNDLIVTKLNAN